VGGGPAADAGRCHTETWARLSLVKRLAPPAAPGAERHRDAHDLDAGLGGAAGIGHVVSLGVLQHGAAPTLADDHLATEELVRSSGSAWTFLRNGFYADSLVARALAEGAVVFGGGQGRAPWVARDDSAEATAVVALAAAQRRRVH
jgi:uncharacterized protein YbjT (DUF2867 family)